MKVMYLPTYFLSLNSTQPESITKVVLNALKCYVWSTYE